MINRNGNPSLTSRLQSSFRTESYLDMHQEIANHNIKTEKNGVTKKRTDTSGSIVCGKTICGDEKEVVKF